MKLFWSTVLTVFVLAACDRRIEPSEAESLSLWDTYIVLEKDPGSMRVTDLVKQWEPALQEEYDELQILLFVDSLGNMLSISHESEIILDVSYSSPYGDDRDFID